MRRIASALGISLIILLPIPFTPLPAASRGQAPQRPAGTADSLSLSSRSDSSITLRIEESGVRLGSGELREPIGVAVDSRGFVYVADAMAGKVYRYAPGGASLEFERPPSSSAFYPIDVAVQESFILVLDYSRNKLLRYDYEGAYLDVLMSFDQFDRVRPVSLTAGPGGRLITADVANHTIALWTPLLDLELTIGGFGWGEGRFNEPRKAAFLPSQEIVAVESGNRRLQFFFPSGRYERTVRAPGGVPFVSPRSVSIDLAGTIFVCDPPAGRISVLSADGASVATIDRYAGESLVPSAAAPGWDGSLYVADLKSHSILVYRLLHPRGK
jgi:streptogramin lyase